MLQYDVKEDQELKVTGSHGINHETVEAELAIGTDVGFRMNPMTGEYELVADLETWNQPISVERFLDKVNQQYARMTIHNTVKDLGFQVSKSATNSYSFVIGFNLKPTSLPIARSAITVSCLIP